MERARQSDAELLRLVRAGGEPSTAALRELEQRHFQAVRVFASACVATSSAADALAGQAWKRAMRPEDGTAGAVRPRALSVVLRTAAAWAGTEQQSVLNPELTAWVHAHMPQPPAGHGDGEDAVFLPPTVAARAFGGIADHSQAVLWHRTVEHDEPERVEEILGPDTEAVSLLERRARSELYNVYVQTHQAGLDDECRPFHRMVLAYAEEKSLDMAADLAPHLEVCAACSRAVADLGRLRVDCGGFLADAVLPWGGEEYSAMRAEEDPAPVGTAVELLPAGVHLTHPPRVTRRRLFGRWGPDGPSGRSRRATRVLQTLALIGLTSLAAAFAFSGNLRPGASQSNEAGPSQSARPPGTPGPARTTATATATATVTATRSSKPPSTSGKPRPPASQPPVGGALLEWLFDNPKSGTVADTSRNGHQGRFRGSPPARVVGKAAQFSGDQAVVSDGPVVDTENSFSVSARVRLDDTEDRQVVVSQDADRASGFMLQYDAEEDRWEMRIPDSDDEDAEEADADEAAADFGPEPGEWTQLTGVYDDNADEIRLYVDGRLEDTTQHDSDFASAGKFAVGRGLSFGEGFRGAVGSIDDVRAFGKALTAGQVAALTK